ncbi:DUF3397 domain-containing protein [Lactobacillus ultunensis]|uniref:DUF3397 domain-containing protein n=1 Tax=Lactobacillus ultunensis DSM 16047 TaxID=525365 RepID=C2EMF6_9LACO|nr:DUF3397 domain-containing protein [Lactobacillus ultunensis]EEJ72165.1 hypothetical protein HMPREF0548_0852 [Lactobacillus ultunensis DSM 16047]QQP27892.1 DUF3397 domain-containing protein [Lactobacillus ultunensis]
MLYIFLVPFIGLVIAFLINAIFPRAQFRGYDVLPFFFIAACNLITTYINQPSFLPYGFLIYFILVIIVSLSDAIKNKNISLSKILRKLWNYLAACTCLWYVGLVILMFV